MTNSAATPMKAGPVAVQVVERYSGHERPRDHWDHSDKPRQPGNAPEILEPEVLLKQQRDKDAVRAEEEPENGHDDPKVKSDRVGHDHRDERRLAS